MNPGHIIKTFKSKKGNGVIIRYPKWEDLDAVTEYVNTLIEEDTFLMLPEKQTHTSEASWMAKTFDDIENNKKIHIVAEVNGQYAGNCEIRIHERHQAHVGDIGISIATQYREEGIGYQLLSMLIEEGKKAGLKLLILHCFENNDRALHLYEKLGFTRSGLVPGVYAYKGSFIGEVTLYLPIENNQ
ncbi:MAG: GNAT family N-acetyltransferase [Patescibacteria group bacterium]